MNLSREKDYRIHLVNHSPNLYDRALRSGDALTTAILAVASVEALTHDLATWLGWLDEHAEECHSEPDPAPTARLFGKQHVWCFSPVGHELAESEARLLEMLDNPEYERQPIHDKILSVLELLYGNRERTATPDLKNFHLLVKVRNEIVHPKSERLSQRLKGNKTNGNVEGHSPLVRRLEAEHLIERVPVHESWMDMLTTPFIDWCLLTTSNVIEDVLGMLPTTKLMDLFRIRASIGRYVAPRP